jgi:hypothetical protein|eukprot:7391821-Prymnesium_polylepis.2
MGMVPLVKRAWEFSEAIACIGSNPAPLQARRYQHSDLADIPILVMVESTEDACEVLITLQEAHVNPCRRVGLVEVSHIPVCRQALAVTTIASELIRGAANALLEGDAFVTARVDLVKHAPDFLCA